MTDPNTHNNQANTNNASPGGVHSGIGQSLKVMGLVAVPVVWVAFGVGGNQAVWTAGLSAMLCLGGALLAHWVVEWPALALNAMNKFLVGMFLRMGVPLGACIFLVLTNGPWKQDGGPYYLLPFYLALLAVETRQSVAVLQAQPTPAGAEKLPSSQFPKAN